MTQFSRSSDSTSATSRRAAWFAVPTVIGLTVLASAFATSTTASGAEGAPTLGVAGSYSVIAGSEITNTGPSVLNRSAGVAPGSSISGFPPGLVQGTTHGGDAEAAAAQAAATNAYGQAAGQPASADIGSAIGGATYVAGVYNASSALGLTGTITLDGQNNLDAVFIFQVGESLTTATDSKVVLINQAQACNVFWQVSESATLGTRTKFQGTLMAGKSVTAVTNTSIVGRLFAQTGAVTLDNNVFTLPECLDEIDDTSSSSSDGTVTVTEPVTDSESPTDDTEVSSSTDETDSTDGSGSTDATDSSETSDVEEETNSSQSTPAITTTTTADTTRNTGQGVRTDELTTSSSTFLTSSGGTSVLTTTSSTSTLAVGLGGGDNGGGGNGGGPTTPQLSQTGVNSSTVPMVAVGLMLLLAGVAGLAFGRPKARHHV